MNKKKLKKIIQMAENNNDMCAMVAENIYYRTKKEVNKHNKSWGQPRPYERYKFAFCMKLCWAVYDERRKNILEIQQAVESGDMTLSEGARYANVMMADTVGAVLKCFLSFMFCDVDHAEFDEFQFSLYKDFTSVFERENWEDYVDADFYCYLQKSLEDFRKAAEKIELK